jgi:hypothetical protein
MGQGKLQSDTSSIWRYDLRSQSEPVHIFMSRGIHTTLVEEK